MNYSELSDFEINKRVGMITLSFTEISLNQYRDRDFFEYCNDSGWQEFDPCSNPADAWPIIVENEISLLFNWNESGIHGATSSPTSEHENTNILRAAMIVFLMMREGGE